MPAVVLNLTTKSSGVADLLRVLGLKNKQAFTRAANIEMRKRSKMKFSLTFGVCLNTARVQLYAFSLSTF
jgi:hypothetical protein